jgi:hypothetical protein
MEYFPESLRNPPKKFLNAFLKSRGVAQSKFVKTARRIVRENPEVFEALLEFEKTGRLPAIKELKKKNAR